MAVSVKFEESLMKFTEHVARAQRWRDEEVEWDYRGFLGFLEMQCEGLLEGWNQLREDKRAQHWSLLSVQRYDFERVGVWLRENRLACPACNKLLRVIRDFSKSGKSFVLDRFATEVFKGLESLGKPGTSDVKVLVKSLATIKEIVSRYQGCRLGGRKLSRTQWRDFVEAVEIVYDWKRGVEEARIKSVSAFLGVLLASPRRCIWGVEDYGVFAPVSVTVSDEIMMKSKFIADL